MMGHMFANNFNNNWNNTSYMQQMMGGNFGSYLGFTWFLGLVTSILLIVLLIALVRYIWKLGDKR